MRKLHASLTFPIKTLLNEVGFKSARIDLENISVKILGHPCMVYSGIYNKAALFLNAILEIEFYNNF